MGNDLVNMYKVYVRMEDRESLIGIFQERNDAEDFAIELEISHSIDSRVEQGHVLLSMIDGKLDSNGNLVNDQAYKDLTGSHYYPILNEIAC